MANRKLLLPGIICILILHACTVSKTPRWLSISSESYCNPPLNITSFNYSIPANTDSVLAQYKDLQPHFSVQSILIMHALGILPKIRTQDTPQLRQYIYDKVLLANSEIDAIAAELDCEGERIDQIAKYVDNVNAKRTTRLTVASIVIGAAAGITSATVTDAGWNKGIAIGAGVAGAGLGLATLNPKGRKIQLMHKRNLLRTVWTGENNNDIPTFLWFMLTEKRISNSGNNNLLNNLKHRWITYQFDGDSSKAARSVNFSEGGIYRADDLHDRAEMINQFQAEIRSISQNVNIFLQELNH